MIHSRRMLGSGASSLVWCEPLDPMFPVAQSNLSEGKEMIYFICRRCGSQYQDFEALLACWTEDGAAPPVPYRIVKEGKEQDAEAP